jgi:hypothetical protein
LSGEEGLDHSGRPGSGVQEALGLVAPQLREQLRLGGGLDPFGDHPGAKIRVRPLAMMPPVKLWSMRTRRPTRFS